MLRALTWFSLWAALALEATAMSQHHEPRTRHWGVVPRVIVKLRLRCRARRPPGQPPPWPRACPSDASPRRSAPLDYPSSSRHKKCGSAPAAGLPDLSALPLEFDVCAIRPKSREVAKDPQVDR